ncbi:hypothetical protein Tco_1045882 [Tanacetum coccineum]
MGEGELVVYVGGGLGRKQGERVDWAFKVFTVFIIILLGFPGPSDGLRLHPIVFFSSGSGLTADSSVLTLTLAFLDFGLDFAQSFPFHAQIQISQNPRGIFINQSKSALEIIKKYGLEQCDVVDIPMVERSKLDEDQNRTPVDSTRYQSMVGSLMYLTSSRPNLVFVVCMGARYQANPTEKHLNHSGCQDTRKSTSILCMRSQLTDYGFDYNKIPLYCDSKSAISLSCNTVQHSRTKHIAVRYHFVKEQVENEIFELSNVKTAYQLADIFTKALARDRFEFLINRLGM